MGATLVPAIEVEDDLVHLELSRQAIRAERVQGATLFKQRTIDVQGIKVDVRSAMLRLP